MFETISPERKRVIWFSNLAVQFEIVKANRFKEIQILGEGLSIRWLNLQHVGILQSAIKHLNLNTRVCSWYRSLDSYDKIPLMSFFLPRRSQEYGVWAEERESHITGQDFGLDLDCKEGSWRDVISDARKLRALFNDYGIRYVNFMSGAHGFHFIVPFSDMPEDVKALKYPQLIAFYKALAEILAKKVKSIDMSVYMSTRVFKAPYTLEKHGNVILPLNDKEFEDLARNELSLDPIWVLNKLKIENRGLYFGGSPDGIKNFIKDWNGWDQ